MTLAVGSTGFRSFRCVVVNRFFSIIIAAAVSSALFSAQSVQAIPLRFRVSSIGTAPKSAVRIPGSRISCFSDKAGRPQAALSLARKLSASGLKRAPVLRTSGVASLEWKKLYTRWRSSVSAALRLKNGDLLTWLARPAAALRKANSLQAAIAECAQFLASSGNSGPGPSSPPPPSGPSSGSPTATATSTPTSQATSGPTAIPTSTNTPLPTPTPQFVFGLSLGDMVELKVSNVTASTYGSNETAKNLTYKKWHVRGGIPLPPGTVTDSDVSKLRILQPSGASYQVIPADFTIMNHWADGVHVRWVQYYFQVSNLPPTGTGSQQDYYLYFGTQNLATALPAQPLSLTQTSTDITVSTTSDTGLPIQFSIDKTHGSLLKSVQVGSTSVLPSNQTTRGFFITDSNGTQYSTVGAPTAVTIDENGPNTVAISAQGSFKNGATSYMGYVYRLRFHAGRGDVEASLLLENRGPRLETVNDPRQKRFQEVVYKSDIQIPGSRTLKLSEFWSLANYTLGQYTLYQDSIPSFKDLSVAPTFDGNNYQDTTPQNEIDNFYLKIRDGNGALVYNQSGLTANPSGNNPVTASNGTRSNGLIDISSGSNRFLFAGTQFWQLNPKSLRVVDGSQVEIGFWPKNSAQGDLTHAQGPVHFLKANTPSQYDGWAAVPCTDSSNSGCNRAYQPDYTYYNLLSGKAHIHRFVLSFDPDLGSPTRMTPSQVAAAAQAPLYALPPGWYWGHNPPPSRKSSEFYLSSYREATNWASVPGLTPHQLLTATQIEKWGKSLFDPSAVCQSNATCITLEERRHRGNGFSLTRRHYGWNVYGEFDWEGGDPDSNAYDLLYGITLAALRNQNPLGLVEQPTDHWTIHDTWRPQNIPSEIPNGGRVYQKGDWELGTGGTQRHSNYPGDVVAALIKNDSDSAVSIVYSALRAAGGYPFVSLSSALASAPWAGGSFTMYYGDGSGHRGKAITNLVYLYKLTGDVSYLTIARNFITYAQTGINQCNSKYGIMLPLEVTSTGESTCTLKYDSNTYGTQQFFMTYYLTKGLVDYLEAYREVYGADDTQIHSWAIQFLTNVYTQTVTPYIPAQVSPYTIFGPDNHIAVYNNPTQPTATQAANMCNTRSINAIPSGVQDPWIVTSIQPLPGGSQPGWRIGCRYYGYGHTDVSLYLIPALEWLISNTSTTGVTSNVDIMARDSMVTLFQYGSVNLNTMSAPTVVPSWRSGADGAADIKTAARRVNQVPFYLGQLP
ncbi:MAG: hypothetical protein K1X79_06610 [Oligoflexia bacterium]|nr:hypothetical protein [Oligoflexia bacterium]